MADKRKRAKALQLMMKLKARGEAVDPKLARIQAARAGTLEVPRSALSRAAEADQTAQDQMVLSRKRDVAGGMLAKGVQGVPFVGEWVDEAFDALDPGRGENLRQIQGAMDRQYPKTAIGSEIGGGIVASIPLAIGAVGAAGKAASTAGKAARGLGLGIAGGGTEGAIAGAGRERENRGAGAVVGGAVGAGFGGVVGALAPLVGSGATKVAKRIKRLDITDIAEQFGVSKPAARVIKGYLQNDDLAGAAATMRKLGDDAMLADAGPATAQLLDTAAETGGEALRVARGAVGDRANKVGQDVGSRLDDILGPADGIKAGQREIAQRTAAARAAAYDRAWATPISYETGGKGEKVLAALKRIPRRYIEPAIQRANERAQMQGQEGFKQIMASIGDDGSVSFSELPNTRQLHELKVALDDIVRDGTDKITGKRSADAVDASGVATLLRDAIKDASPAYERATRLGGDKIAEENALLIGKNLLRKATTVEDVAEVMKGASIEAKAAARRGLRESIEDTLSEVKRTITDPDTDAREMMQLVKEMSSRKNTKKVQMVLGQNAKPLFDELEKAEAALALRAAMARNSATAVRTAGREAIQAETQPNLVRRTLGKSGGITSATQDLTETLAGIDPKSMSQRERALMAEIANALTGKRGPDARKALVAVRRAMKGQPLKDQEAKLIGDMFAGGLSSLGYQAGTQTLAP